MLAIMDQRVRKVFKASKARLVLQAHRVKLDQQAVLEKLAPQDRQEIQAQLDLRVPREKSAQQGQTPQLLALRVLQEKLDRRAHKASKAITALRDRREYKAIKVMLDLRDPLAILAPRDRRVRLVRVAQ